MKKLLCLLLFLTFLLPLFGCSTNTYRGTDALMEKARQELPLADAGTIDLIYAGLCGTEDTAIAWFIAGNAHQARYYLPLEVEIKPGRAEYVYLHTHKPLTDRAQDTAVVILSQGYAFLIHNPAITSVKMTMPGGELYEEAIPGDAIPYAFYVPFAPEEYSFLDAQGNVVP